jgi:hypothetical protein
MATETGEHRDAMRLPGSSPPNSLSPKEPP